MKTNVVRINAKDHDAPRDAARPFRLWDVKRKRNIPHRYYAIKQNAGIAALIECRWECKPGEAIEVYDARTARMIGQYIRTVDSVRFIDGGK